MAQHRYLSNAPIREAIIDIQFLPVVGIESVDRFAAAFASQEQGKMTDVWTATLELKIEPTGMRPSQTGSRVGRRVDLADGKHVVQFRTSGFTFSRLHPYESWEVMSEKALGIWEGYFEAMKPSSIARVATRFINAITLPLPIADYSNYLTYAPDVPDTLPQTIAGFLNQVQIVDAGNSDITVVTQTTEAWTPDQKGLVVLLDIDASHTPGSQIEDLSQVSVILNRLRDTKNKAFFGFLEEPALEPYK
ncbi:TIGR04255 family protein [Paraburkholderia sediminicola]|uniref:TIGR04255 family protein n=1 Tax=Paraburkholderia sediminicola TaxID=458836 RepID=UPI0038BA8AFB